MTAPKLLQGGPYDLSGHGFEWLPSIPAWGGTFGGWTIFVHVSLDDDVEVEVKTGDLRPLEGVYRYPHEVVTGISDLIREEADGLREEADAFDQAVMALREAVVLGS